MTACGLLLLALTAGAAEDTKEVPPASIEISAHAGWGQLTYWQQYYAWSIGLGLRGLYGKHIGPHHRLGGGLGWSLEGPIPSAFSTALEPQLAWDAVYGKFTMGASVGVSGFMHYYLGLRDGEVYFSAAPMASLRIGYADGWPSLHPSLFIVFEPRVRYMQGQPSFMFAVTVGSRSEVR